MTEHAITDWATVSKYKLGYVEEPLQGDGRFKGKLVIPYLTPTGTAHLKFRRITGDSGGKYDQHHGMKPRLYNTQAYFDAEHEIGIAEGEIDAIVATERLHIPTMGVPGADGWKPNAGIWSPLFKDFTRVFIFADGDDSGKRFAGDVADSLGWRARIVQCAPSMDVASTVAQGNADALCQLARE